MSRVALVVSVRRAGGRAEGTAAILFSAGSLLSPAAEGGRGGDTEREAGERGGEEEGGKRAGTRGTVGPAKQRAEGGEPRGGVRPAAERRWRI